MQTLVLLMLLASRPADAVGGPVGDSGATADLKSFARLTISSVVGPESRGADIRIGDIILERDFRFYSWRSQTALGVTGVRKVGGRWWHVIDAIRLDPKSPDDGWEIILPLKAQTHFAATPTRRDFTDAGFTVQEYEIITRRTQLLAASSQPQPGSHEPIVIADRISPRVDIPAQGNLHAIWQGAGVLEFTAGGMHSAERVLIGGIAAQGNQRESPATPALLVISLVPYGGAPGVTEGQNLRFRLYPPFAVRPPSSYDFRIYTQPLNGGPEVSVGTRPATVGRGFLEVVLPTLQIPASSKAILELSRH